MACYTVIGIGDMSISDGGHESRKIPTIICRACNAIGKYKRRSEPFTGGGALAYFFSAGVSYFEAIS